MKKNGPRTQQYGVFMRKLLVLIFLTLIFMSQAQAQDTDDAAFNKAFYQANIAYEGGNYDNALDIYRSFLDRGLKSSSLFYNMANAYYRKGEIGEAILNYKRAKWLSPRDGDIVANYFHAKSQLKRQDSRDERIILLQWIDHASQAVTVKELTLICLFFFYILVAYFITTKIFKVFPLYSNQVIITILLVLFIFVTAYIQRIYAADHEAVVLDKIADARYEPKASAEVHYPVYEGMKVYILRSKEGWSKIRRPNGKIGWLPSKSIEKVSI